MARTALSVQRPTSSGITLTMSAANVDGHSLPSDQSVLLVVTNGGGSSVSVTLPTPGVVDSDLAVPDRVVTVPAGETRYLAVGGGAFKQQDGTVHVNFSSVTSVTVGALRP